MSKNYETKQVILMRTDLRNTQGQKVRSGKLMAQAAHASMMWLSKRVQNLWKGYVIADSYWEHLNTLDTNPAYTAFTEAEKTWLNGSFAKIVLAVDSEEQLQGLIIRADAYGVQAHVCTDAGATEFGGVPTVTCAAIGPATSDIIDLITGHLRPL